MKTSGIIFQISAVLFSFFLFSNTSIAQGDVMPRATNKTDVVRCKLSSKQMYKRKVNVLNILKHQILETRELTSGYAFKFSGTDKMLNNLTEFIRTERECCDFFVFGLSISGDKSEAWLEITGPEGAKDFISEELGLVDR